MVETRSSTRKRLLNQKTKRSVKVKSRKTVTQRTIFTRNMARVLLEEERIRRVRVKPEKLTDLPVEVLIEIMKKVDEENIGTVPQISVRMRNIFKKFEHEFVPPASSSQNSTLKCTITRKGLELIFETIHGRQIMLNPSFSRLMRYLRDLCQFDFECKVKPPNYFTRGTQEYKRLKKFIKEHCSIPQVAICNPQIDYIAGDVMDMFSEQTQFVVCIDINKLMIEPKPFFEKNIRRLTVTGTTPKNVAEYLMHNRKYEELYLFCSQPLRLLTVVQQWKRKERKISVWEITCRYQYDQIPPRTIVYQPESDTVLKIFARREGPYWKFRFVEA